MPVWAAAILSTLGAVAIKMLTQLATETFLKKTVILTLEKIAEKTDTDIDNKLLDAAKEAWGQ